MNTNTNTKITVSIAENGVWVTDAHIRRNRLDVNGWEDGAALIPGSDGVNSDYDDEIYSSIADAILAGDESGRIEMLGSVYTWKIS